VKRRVKRLRLKRDKKHCIKQEPGRWIEYEPEKGNKMSGTKENNKTRPMHKEHKVLMDQK
jgi:hypothetical protein